MIPRVARAILIGIILLTAVQTLGQNDAAATPEAAASVDLTHLPLGDKLLSTSPKQGWIWPCHVDPNAGGAQTDGPWIDEADQTYNLRAKISVQGSVNWPNHQYSMTVQGDERIITTNDLPDHATGIFPIQSSDPAYQIDRNPNRITTQNMTIDIPANPTLAATPTCTPGAVGVLITGVALFNALDGPGRDAVAHETQDACDGHPDEGGVYHYHSLTPCINDMSGSDGLPVLVGYAIDGFGIYGRYENGKLMTDADLDECHGHSSPVLWDGKVVTMYHYTATYVFPYTIGCMRGTYEMKNVQIISGPPPQGQGQSGQGQPPQGQGRPPQGQGQRPPPPSPPGGGS